MPKYYIKSGTIEIIISRKDVLDASVAALLMANKNDTIDEFFYIDERGYRDYISATPDTTVIESKHVISAAESELFD